MSGKKRHTIEVLDLNTKKRIKDIARRNKIPSTIASTVILEAILPDFESGKLKIKSTATEEDAA